MSNAQELFENLILTETDLSGLAATIAVLASPSDRGSALTRIYIGVDYCNKLLNQLLQLTDQELPFRDKFLKLSDVYQRRLSALEEIGNQSRIPTVGAMTTVSWVVELVDEPLREIVDGLKTLAAISSIENFLRWCLLRV